MPSSTQHKIYYQDSRTDFHLPDKSVDLIVTSPPYPMINLWDELFYRLNNQLSIDFIEGNGYKAFDIMHEELLKVWTQCYRVLKPGGFMCINVGDATRSLQKRFHLFCNHSRIIENCIQVGFHALPHILWRKSTSSPAKFMGSGTLPGAAYVTLEHEYILIFRKEDRRQFKTEDDKQLRRESSFFWEERNLWFSDMWEIQGTRQNLHCLNENMRQRSAAFPFEVPYRLIQMFSLQGDTICDPFMGTGTTSLAAIATARNSIGIEIDEEIENAFILKKEQFIETKQDLNELHDQRLSKHQAFMKDYTISKKAKHFNSNLGCNVVSSSETQIKLYSIGNITMKNREIEVMYDPI